MHFKNTCHTGIKLHCYPAGIAKRFNYFFCQSCQWHPTTFFCGSRECLIGVLANHEHTASDGHIDLALKCAGFIQTPSHQYALFWMIGMYTIYCIIKLNMIYKYILDLYYSTSMYQPISWTSHQKSFSKLISWQVPSITNLATMNEMSWEGLAIKGQNCPNARHVCGVVSTHRRATMPISTLWATPNHWTMCHPNMARGWLARS